MIEATEVGRGYWMVRLGDSTYPAMCVSDARSVIVKLSDDYVDNDRAERFAESLIPYCAE